MNKIRQNFGFIEPAIKSTDRFLGQGILPRIVLEEYGNWVDSLPEAEPQFHGAIDSINCVAFKTLDQIEAYEKKAFGEINNYSERWVGIIAGTTSKGNDPSKVYDAIEQYGLIPEEMLPWSDDIKTLDEYFSFKGADKDACFQEGKAWKARKDFLHNWVFRADQPLDEKLNNMKVALRYSPLAFDVAAWQTNSEGKYIRFGLSGHWTTCYRIADFEYVFNSYPPFLKELTLDFNHFYCKRISITKKIPLTVAQKKSIWQILVSFLFGEPEELKKLEPTLNPDFIPMKTNKEKLIELCLASVGKDASPKDLAPDDRACAETLSTLLQGVWSDFKVVVSTITLKKVFDVDARFERILKVEPWAIIMSATEGGRSGHCGIVGEDGITIYSNRSKTGTWEGHWKLPDWIEYYGKKQRLQVCYFRV